VAELVELKPDPSELPLFQVLLEALAHKHGWHAHLERCREAAPPGWWEPRAVALRVGEQQYVVVVLKSSSPLIPGIDSQVLILLDGQGRFRDDLSCDISNRLTHFAEFRTLIPDQPEFDGAHLVVRLDGDRARGNFSHDITHNGRSTEFYWGEDHLPPEHPTKWDRYGLCSIAIVDGEFKILFPGGADEMPPRR
jgi:hypothetical protein